MEEQTARTDMCIDDLVELHEQELERAIRDAGLIASGIDAASSPPSPDDLHVPGAAASTSGDKMLTKTEHTPPIDAMVAGVRPRKQEEGEQLEKQKPAEGLEPEPEPEPDPEPDPKLTTKPEHGPECVLV